MTSETNQSDPQPGNDAAAGEPSGSDVRADRLSKLERIRSEFGIDAYGRRVDGLVSLADARGRYDEAADEAHKADAEHDRRPRVKVAGRIMQHRVMGNLIFLSLRDDTGDLQVAVSKKAVGTATFKLAKLADLSDIVVAEGALARTKTGEITVWAEGERGYELATKSLAPPPGKWHGLQDAEQRYRRRYVDLYANPQVMRTMQLRTRVVDAVRDFMRSRGYLEVETPMLQPVHGGAAARPFVTHHNALDMPLYLRIAPELYLKRLLVGGMPRVFEINRNFRNEGVSPRHNPEFTMLEAYEAFGSWETMAELMEELICTVAQQVLGTLTIEHRDERGEVIRTIDLTRPWRRASMVELIEQHTGWRFDKRPLQEARADWEDLLQRAAERRYAILSPREVLPQADEPGVDEVEAMRVQMARTLAQNIQDHFKSASLSPGHQLVEVYEKLVEPTLIEPTFVTHLPSAAIPLAKQNEQDPYFVDVYELAINGVEISPGYTELNDPQVQEQRFKDQLASPDEQQQHDEDFLEALRVGMPPAGGIGLGIDRLVMLLTGAEAIRDVIPFPLMRRG